MFFKFLLTVALVAAIWFGFNFLQRLVELKERRRRAPDRVRQQSPDAVHDLVECPACHVWLAGPAPRSCGRPGCPYRR